jgi:hypothetical protein
VRRAACAATFPPAGGEGAGRATLPPLRGAWYATLVAWGWLTLLAAGQSVAHVLGGLWLAIGLPWARSVTRWRDDAKWTASANWLAVALAGAGVRTLEHAGLSRLAETMVAVDHEPGDGAADALRRAAAGCASAGVPDLAPLYAALAGRRLPPGIWSSVAPAAPAPPGDHGPASGEAVSAAPADEPGGRAPAAASPLGQEVRHELL